MNTFTETQKLKDILYICNSFNILEHNLFNNQFNTQIPIHHIYIGIFKNKPFIGVFKKLPKGFSPKVQISSGDFQTVYNEYTNFLVEYNKKTL